MNSFGHDFQNALTARSIDDEYRQIERLYGPRNTSWQFVRQSLSMGPAESPVIRPDIAKFLGPDGVRACQDGSIGSWLQTNSDRVGAQGMVGFVALCAPSGRRYDIITIRLPNGNTRDVYFDITSFMGGPGAWPDHAAGRILPGAEMNVSDITGAGQAAGGSTTAYGPVLLFLGLASLAAYGLGRMAEYRPYRPNPCGCAG